ncbi:MAG: hypothetical protein IBJ09_04425 [Bacteroidia bacterium]|nr:hypothetical protein [Bacteroidia bacterium]
MKHIYLFLSLCLTLYSAMAKAQTDTFRVVFAYNSAELPANFPQADWNQYDDIEIRAYSSGPGTAEYNMQLSEKRARKVHARIESLPHMIKDIDMKWFGEDLNPDSPDTDNDRTTLIICQRPPVYSLPEPVKEEPVYETEPVFGIEVRDILSQQKIKNFSSTPGEKKGSEQAFSFKAEGYKDTTVFLSKKNYVAYLTPVQVKKIVRMENLLFYPNSAALLPESEAVLAGYLEELRGNTTDCFEIHGHVNAPYGMQITQTPHDLQILSENRALTVYKEMRRIGIPAANMKHKGYSNARMVYPNARAESEMRMNRRVEIIVVECPLKK